MRLADFFENFEVLAAAPGGVARLREATHCDQLQSQLQTRSDRARILLHSAIHQLSQTA